MPRSVTTSRVIVEGTIATGDIPASSGDMVTIALDVPRRGYIHRATLIWGRSSAFGLSQGGSGAYLHTVCAAGAGAGATRLTSADAQSIFAQSPVNPGGASEYGGQLAIGSNIYTWAPSLDFAPGMKTNAVSSGASGGGPSGIFYDASLGKLGPNEGGATLFFTWIGDADLSGDAIFCKLRLEIEPVQ